MSEHIVKSHNKTLLLYHIVCPAKYRRDVFTQEVEEILKDVCVGISQRYEINFVEIGTDEDHVHFLIQTVPMMRPKDIVQKIKSITAREVFTLCPEVKKALWGGEFWGKGYFINTVGRYADEQVISRYVKNQGVEQEYKIIHKNYQLSLF